MKYKSNTSTICMRKYFLLLQLTLRVYLMPLKYLKYLLTSPNINKNNNKIKSKKKTSFTNDNHMGGLLPPFFKTVPHLVCGLVRVTHMYVYQ